MIVNLQMTCLPPGSQIGPLFDVIPLPSGVSVPAQVDITDLLDPAGITVTVPDGTTGIQLQSTGSCNTVINVTLTPPNCGTTTTTTQPVLACLDGLIIEGLYLNSLDDLNYLPVGYTHPCPDKVAYHVCNRAFFEVYGNGVYIGDILLNNATGIGGPVTVSGKNTCQDYNNIPTLLNPSAPWNEFSRYSKTVLNQSQALAIAATLTPGSTVINFSVLAGMTTYNATCDNTNLPHSDINWVRITSPTGTVLYNSCVVGNSVVQIDICTGNVIIPTTTTTTFNPAGTSTIYSKFNIL